MAFARSASGPAGLSINTTSANSLFGSTPATTQPASSTPASNMSGLFGNTAASSAPQQGGLFGASKPAGTSLFGTPTTQPAQTGNLFSGLGQTQTQQNQNQQTPNLFAGLGSTQQAQPSNTLFGNLNQNKPEQKNMFAGLGQTDAQKQEQAKQDAPKPFGATTFGGLSFGQATTTDPKTPSVPGVKINVENLRPTTRFNDLHEDLQKMIEQIDNTIQAHMQQKHQCDAIMPKHEEQLNAIPNDVDFCTRKGNQVENVLAIDAEGIFQAKKLVQMDAQAAKLSFQAVDNLKLPPQYQQLGPWSGGTSTSAANSDISSQLPNFFLKEADEMLGTLDVYKKNMSEIEAHLRDVEARAVHQFMQSQSRAQNEDPNEPIRELAATFREFEHGILNVAGKVVDLREEVDQIKRVGLLGAPGGGNENGNGGGPRRGVY